MSGPATAGMLAVLFQCRSDDRRSQVEYSAPPALVMRLPGNGEIPKKLSTKDAK